MVTMELDVFAEYARLPKGYKFHEWVPGNRLAESPELMCAIERENDGKFAAFSVSIMKQPATRGVVLLEVGELNRAVGQAIAELEK